MRESEFNARKAFILADVEAHIAARDAAKKKGDEKERSYNAGYLGGVYLTLQKLGYSLEHGENGALIDFRRINEPGEIAQWEHEGELDRCPKCGGKDIIVADHPAVIDAGYAVETVLECRDCREVWEQQYEANWRKPL